MAQYLVQFMVDGKWKTKFYLPTLERAIKCADSVGGTNCYRIMHKGKRVD